MMSTTTTTETTRLSDTLEIACAVGDCDATASIDLFFSDPNVVGKTYSMSLPDGWVLRQATKQTTDCEGNQLLLCPKHRRRRP